jgi:hypothetical protein
MELTLEQKERIRVNRERALEILKRKREQEAATATAATASTTTITNHELLLYNDNNHDKKKMDSSDTKRHKGNELSKNGTEESIKETIDMVVDVLEEFEETASEWVTKAEAKKMYCLPEGTLAVCTCVEKPNPRNKAWTPMKMYSRAEVRAKARKRYGGLEGLVAERNQRDEKKFAKDMERSQQIFATSSSSRTKTATASTKKKNNNKR